MPGQITFKGPNQKALVASLEQTGLLAVWAVALVCKSFSCRSSLFGLWKNTTIGRSLLGKKCMLSQRILSHQLLWCSVITTKSVMHWSIPFLLRQVAKWVWCHGLPFAKRKSTIDAELGYQSLGRFLFFQLIWHILEVKICWWWWVVNLLFQPEEFGVLCIQPLQESKVTQFCFILVLDWLLRSHFQDG